MRRALKPGPINLTVAQQEKFKEQILIILADYQDCKDPYAFGSTNDGIRIEVTNRIMNNLRIISTLRSLK
jgi:hypothetical protein